MLDVILIISLFIFGACFGSLASVLMTRLGENIDWQTIKGVLIGHSMCPHCKHRLSATNLIPILSFFLQKGKCSYCHKPISNIYPILEIVSGIVFVLSYFFTAFYLPSIGVGFSIANTIFFVGLNWFLFMLIVYDFQKYELHVPIWILSLAFVLLFQFLNITGDYKFAFLGSLVFGALFYAIYYFSKLYMRVKYKNSEEGMGEGDAMMAFLIGTLVPFIFRYNNFNSSFISIIELFVIFILMSSLIGLVFAIARKVLPKYIYKYTKYSFKRIQIPFIPIMILSFWILIFVADKLVFILFPTIG